MPKSNTHDLLKSIVRETKCLPNWSFNLGYDDDDMPVLHITIEGTNNYDHTQAFTVTHCHPVPNATYNEKSWRRWILEQCIRTMNHELGENLRFGVGGEVERPYAPMHGPGEDPYTIHEVRSETDALRTQSGSLRPKPV